MAVHRVGEAWVSLEYLTIGKQKSLKKKKDGDMPKGHRRHVKDAPNGHMGITIVTK